MATHLARRLSRRGLPLAVLAVGTMVLQASECTKDDFYDAFGGLNLTGRITGTVTLDGDPAPGVTVTARQGGTVIDTGTTNASGLYQIPELNVGIYMVSTSITGAICPEQTATVGENQDTVANIPCMTPEPQTGTVTGTVTVNGTPESGATVTLREGTTVIGTTTTGSNGTYTFTNVATGTKTVAVTPPEGATCPDPQNVNVPAGGTAPPADFPCTRPTSNIPGASEIPGTYTSTVTRTSTQGSCTPAVGGGTVTITSGLVIQNLDPLVTINGTYNAGTGAISGTGSQTLGNGFTVNTTLSGTFSVQANQILMQDEMVRMHTAPNSQLVCTENYDVTLTRMTASSRRFKREVVALLPGGANVFGLRPVSFRYRAPWGDPAIVQIGLIAEELVDVFPRAVFHDPDGRPALIDYKTLTREVAREGTARAAAAAKAGIRALAEAL